MQRELFQDDGSSLRQEDAIQKTKKSGFSRAVRSEQAEEVTLRDIEGDVVQDREVGIPERDVFNPKAHVRSEGTVQNDNVGVSFSTLQKIDKK